MAKNHLIKANTWTFRINEQELLKAKNAYLSHNYEILDDDKYIKNIKCKTCSFLFVEYYSHLKISMIKNQWKDVSISYLTCDELIIKGLLE
jgi:hypothetical protein